MKDTGETVDETRVYGSETGLEAREAAPSGANGNSPEPVRAVSVPEEPDPIRGGAPVANVETWIVTLFFGVVYGVVGYFLLTDARIVNFDALQRLNEAYMVWWNSPPKLAAIPLDVAPMGSIAFMPLTLIKPLATSLVAIPVISAVAAGFLMATLNSAMRRCDFPALLRYPVLVLFGLNPMFVYYAANGDTTVLGMVLAGLALLSVITWRISTETRHLAVAGLAIGTATMFDYGYGLWALGLALAIMLIGTERESSGERQRSSLIVFLTPVAYALLVWTLLNLVILGDPFEWLTTRVGQIQVNTTGVLQAITATPGSAFGDLAEVVLGVAPLGFAAILFLLLAAFLSRNSLALGLFLLALVAIAVPVGRVLIADQADLMDLSTGLPLALLALAGMIWLYWSEEGWRVAVVVVMLIGLIAAIPLGWNAMQDYQYQNQAEAFTRWVDTGDSQEGTASVGGYTVGIDPEVAMASYIKENLPQESDSILVDENFSYGPMILSGRPKLFFDRADEGELQWEAALDDPYGTVSYMLITYSRGGDQLRKQYPEAISGGELGFTPVFRTDRYVLLEVSGTRPPADQVADPGEVIPNRTPTPFTPQRPPDPLDPGSGVAVPGTTQDEAVAPTPAPAQQTGPASPGQSTAPQIEGE